MIPAPPEGGLVLRVHARFLSRGDDGKLRHAKPTDFALMRDITKAAPSVWPLVESINNLILTGDMYKALKQAKKLVTYEEELVNHAKRRTSLRHSGQADRQSA